MNAMGEVNYPFAHKGRTTRSPYESQAVQGNLKTCFFKFSLLSIDLFSKNCIYIAGADKDSELVTGTKSPSSLSELWRLVSII
jgi:hypothetical protein